MDRHDQEFRRRLLATFREEAGEHLTAISTGLVELEKCAEEERRRELVESVFREAHSLKGAARAVDLTDVELVCQGVEGLLAAIKRGEQVLQPGTLDLLFRALDVIQRLLPRLEEALTSEERTLALEVRRQLAEVVQGRGSSPAPPAPEPHPSAIAEPISDSLRIPKQKLDALLLQIEELVSVKRMARQHLSDVQAIKVQVERWREECAQHHVPGGHPTSAAARSCHCLEWNQSFGSALGAQLASLKKTFADDERSVGALLDTLLSDVKGILMLPCSSLFAPMQKLVRDLVRTQGKEIELRVTGAELEVDSRVLQELKDPIIHLLRNAIDHGIEPPEVRSAKQKPTKGRLDVAISQLEGGKMELTISDDGRGIEPGSVRNAAIAKRMVSLQEAERLTDEEALALVFRSGFSTRHEVNELSGHGLGLAIVQEKVDKLRGTIDLQTHPDTGTTFRIVVPVTLATFRATLVRVGRQIYAIPTRDVRRLLVVRPNRVKTVSGEETVELQGQVISLVKLETVLELVDHRPALPMARCIQVLILGEERGRIGFQVDDVLQEEELLVKGLGPQLERVRNVSGATVLGMGEVILVLNVADLLKSAMRLSGRRGRGSAPTGAGRARSTKTILVVESSIAARALVKSILEAAGYGVLTAIDGFEALLAVQNHAVDLVISTLQLPRMNGLELVQKLRASPAHARLPVILLGASEERGGGAAVAVDEYVVKSSLERGNLLEAVGRAIRGIT